MPKIDLLLIHPGAARGIYGELGEEFAAIEPPLWARLIAGYVRDRGHTVRIIDAEARGYSAKEVATVVETARPRLICIAAYGHQPSASTQQMAEASAIASAIRSNRDVFGPIIMVGGHVSALARRTMAEEAIDYACVGEGPITVERLLAGDDRATIPGLVWRDGDRLFEHEVHVNPSAPLIEDLAQLHGDAWDLLPMPLYRAHNWQCFDDLSKRKPYASIYTSLGCPYKCSFCCINAPFESNRYRMRKPKDVVREIGDLYERYGITTFKIVDEMFVLNERHYTEIAHGLIAVQRGIDLAKNAMQTMRADFKPPDQIRDPDHLNIWAYARVDTVKPHTLSLLRKAGFRWLALGIESGSKYVRDGAQKQLKNEDIVGVVRAIQAAGINVIGNYIFGLPDDDVASMRSTLLLAHELRTEFANFYSAMAYPGSRLYDEAVKAGSPLPETWAGYSQHNEECRPLDTKHVDGATVLRFRDEAFQTYFTDPGYRGMIKRKFGAETLLHVQAMTRLKLPRKLLAALKVE